MPSRVHVRARPSAISHFLLSQPSHVSSFLPPFVDRNEGVTTKNLGDFLKNLPSFSDYLPRFFFCSDFLQHRFFFHEKPVVSWRSCFGSFSRLFPPLFLYFLALQHSNIKECLWNRRNHLSFSRLCAHLWRLWKQKSYFAGCARVRARERPWFYVCLPHNFPLSIVV